MTTTINANTSAGLVCSGDTSGIVKLQSNGVTTNALAWVNFNGTGTVAIRSSYNVSSITDGGTGDYTVNLTTAMPDTNYVCVSSSDGPRDTFKTAYPSTTSAIKFGLYQGPVSGNGVVDRSIVQVLVFGN